MEHDRAFLQAIAEAPDDDAPRLIYADWLEDHGRPERAAFVRAQVSHAALPEVDPDRLALEDEADDLLRAHEADWLGPLPELAQGWRWGRGFVEQVTLRPEGLREHGERLFDLFPIREVRLPPEHGEKLPALADAPVLARIERLDLGARPDAPDGYRGHYLRDRPLRPLLASPALRARLTHLYLPGNGLGPETAVTLALGLLGRLRVLDLSSNPGLGGSAVRALLEGRPALLEVLRLRGCNLTEDGARALFAAEGLPHLVELDVEARFLFAGVLGRPGGLPLLLRSPLLPRLRRLSLADVRLSDDQLRALAAAPQLRGLRSLDLARCGLGPTAGTLLAASPLLAGLEELDLSANALGRDGVAALAASPHLTGLRVLKLTDTGARDAGAVALASAGLPSLRVLELENNRVGGPGLRALAASPLLGGLRELRLGGNYVGPTGVRAFADSPRSRRLERLGLTSTRFEAEAARALAESDNFPSLRALGLAQNYFDAETVRILGQAPRLARLRELALTGTALGDAGLAALIDAPLLRHLRRLDLRPLAPTSGWAADLRRRFGAAVVFGTGGVVTSG